MIRVVNLLVQLDGDKLNTECIAYWDSDIVMIAPHHRDAVTPGASVPGAPEVGSASSAMRRTSQSAWAPAVNSLADSSSRGVDQNRRSSFAILFFGDATPLSPGASSPVFALQRDDTESSQRAARTHGGASGSTSAATFAANSTMSARRDRVHTMNKVS
jgi:hypothetical protein